VTAAEIEVGDDSRELQGGDGATNEGLPHGIGDGRNDNMIFITIRRRTLILIILAIILVIAAACVVISMPRMRRAAHGAKPGVRLRDVDVGGLYQEEVRSVVLGLAGSVERMPREAIYYAETGDIISEEPGIVVDIDNTVKSVMAAPRGANVDLVTRQVTPAVTAAMLKAIYSVKTSEPAVALAFNVAWGEEWVPAILEILAESGVRTTFFITGTWAVKFPQMVQAMVASGHEIANHGYDHPHPEQLTEKELVTLIEKNETLLRELTGVRTRLFAPPYGEVNQRIASVAGRLGYATIMWTVDTIDWQRPDPAVIVERAERRLAGGNIILVHPTEPTAAALPTILKRLAEKGYKVFTVSRLLELGPPVHTR